MALNVLDYGAVPNSGADSTGPFQAALDDAGDLDNDASTVVYAPAGTYHIQGALTIPGNVTLEGDWRAPAYWSPNVAAIKGTILMAYAGAGDVNGLPFITLAGHAAGVRGLAIFYPEQSETVKPYPPTIRGGFGSPDVGFLDNLAVTDCLLANPYHAVDFATHRCGRHLIRGLYGQPLRVGIEVDGCLDIGRIEDVHFWPFWRDTVQAKTQTGTNAFALVLRRSDWQIVHNFFALGYHSGILFGHGLHRHPTGDPNLFAGGCNGQFSNINLDAADVGIDIYTTSGAGIHFSNLNIACTDEFGHANRCAVWAHPNARDMPADLPVSAMSIANGSFWGQFKDQVVLWEKGGPLHLSSSIFRSAPIQRAAVVVTGGEAIITGNTFSIERQPCAVEVGPNVQNAIVAHNILHGHRLSTAGPNCVVSDNRA
jgi:hypothetical protein